MATGRKDDSEELGDERTASLLGPTPATYSYNDALLMGRMTEAELAQVKLELFGEEIVDVEEVASAPPPSSARPGRSLPPPLPPEASPGASPAKIKPPPLPAEARRTAPPSTPRPSAPPPSAPPRSAPQPTVPLQSAPPPSAPPRSAPPASVPPRSAPPASAPPLSAPVVPPPSKLPPPIPRAPTAASASPRETSPRKAPPPVPRTAPQRIKAMIAENDYAGALALAEREMLATPESAELQRYADACRTAIARVYLAELGRRSDIPRIIMGGAELRGLVLDRWAAFVMSRVDGESSIEDIIDMSGMVELDTLRILYELQQRGVVGVRPAQPSRTP